MKPLAALLFACALRTACAQTASPAKPAAGTYTGCVSEPMGDAMQGAPKTYWFSSGELCLQLSGIPPGKFDAGQLPRHQVTFRGTATGATETTPATLKIDSVVQVGPACEKTCTPEPPGGRGLHRKKHYGTEAGTAGEQAPRPAPQ